MSPEIDRAIQGIQREARRIATEVTWARRQSSTPAIPAPHQQLRLDLHRDPAPVVAAHQLRKPTVPPPAGLSPADEVHSSQQGGRERLRTLMRRIELFLKRAWTGHD
jgi:hypothetical protein